MPYDFRRSGLMASGLSCPGSSPGWGHCVVFLGKTLYSHVASLRPGVNKQVLPNVILGYSCDGLTSHPGGSRNTPSRFMLLKPEISADLMVTWLVCRLYLTYGYFDSFLWNLVKVKSAYEPSGSSGRSLSRFL